MKPELTLDSFLLEMDRKQAGRYSMIPIFDPDEVQRWSQPEKEYFAKVFYHTRGHFDRLLWMRLSHAPTAEDKKSILGYMAEEVGLESLDSDGNFRSHEELFEAFAESLGVELNAELTEERFYLPFARNFNQGLIDWFRRHDWEMQTIGFSAYERLDNVDYEFLYKIARTLGAEGDSLAYFEVHRGADHFEKTSKGLPDAWEKNPSGVKSAYDYVYSHQREMWQGLAIAMHDMPLQD